ncbi:MAG: thioredoxin family protein [Crenarchaeota archaeon]|nr:MAG: thioredoxin family protein [Thermoproteota archaeon]RDJ33115.1 MAG: thioredoxin family protein [Thermoproteota archaeon]RDJ36569.1 MAG: thioredoxin family protein [Thermoproteota archaeon]RDJ39011.1 MAG: thioredoxin family protein [Thermoproteota archaeon]
MVLLESQIKLKTGDKIPDFSLKGIDDKIHSVSDYKDYDGKLIIFMCNHCPYVKAKVEAIKEIHEKFSDKVAVVGINSNDPIAFPDDNFENMKKTASEKGIKFDYLVDDTQEVAKRFGAMCTPDPFLFDKNGNLVFHGRIDNAMKPEDVATEKTMIDNITKLLNQEKIQKDFDPSIGCSIKWKEN